ncbi:site-specific DNA-methyltransferase [Nitratidesulfovibrio liaohensis]|uniref:Methyltransferase n=1 Tax=Nitratidesulfovibrio liaohensis TaxID=2604158 RepID=A0ABY9R0L4_9BACT|nr:site-specific DNA-methyltransferase [Nitratidesulfovibrio liaohensis]WMW64363.1 site-specific DNA-methyltransferase [Nitratidesulfovibrio liaohensis]
MPTAPAITASMFVGDCMDGLRAMPDQSVHCCVTSPPYYGLRDYGMPGQIGLEDAPDAYVDRLVDVFREVSRVLHPTGTLWLNIADSYAGSCKGAWKNKDAPKETYSPDYQSPQLQMARVFPGIKPKDLIGIPWMLAFALRADGWYLRQDIIWEKPNCMPESVRDRCTKSHEYVFLLSKSPRYFFDADAVKEPATGSASGNKARKMRPCADVLNRGAQAGSVPWDGALTRNRRSVWSVPTAKFDGAHFAVFPPALVEPCVLAGTSSHGVCPACGNPWARVIERTGHENMREQAHQPGNRPTKTDSTGWAPLTRTTDKWSPTCDCGKAPVPSTVLDPFAGTGTTGEVAVLAGRCFVGCELNPAYVADARARIAPALQGAKERPVTLLEACHA